jgi:hypothetical protein
MKILFIDGQAGAAGDMILGALVDLGVDPNTLKNALRPIVPSDFELHIERVSPNGIAATQLTVKTGEDIKHRHLSQILELLAKGSLSQGVRGRVEGVFRRLAAAEAKIHSSTIDNVHFHEVGANDAIIDIVGAIWALEALSIERVFCAPLVLGSGVGTSVHARSTIRRRLSSKYCAASRSVMWPMSVKPRRRPAPPSWRKWRSLPPIARLFPNESATAPERKHCPTVPTSCAQLWGK